MTPTRSATKRTLDLEFLYIDLTTCTRCRGTDENLSRALDAVREVLSAAGVAVNVRKVLVDSEEKAREHRLVSSPTIRVNGHDVALATKESRCGACSDLAGQGTDCRVWTYDGAEYTEAPEALLVDAILRAAYAPAPAAAGPEPYAGVPENLLRFFAAKAGSDGGPCCPSTGDGGCCGAEVTVAAPVAEPVVVPKASRCGCGATTVAA